MEIRGFADEMFFVYSVSLVDTNTALSDSFSFRPSKKPITLSQRSGRLIFGSQTFFWTFCPGKCLHLCVCVRYVYDMGQIYEEIRCLCQHEHSTKYVQFSKCSLFLLYMHWFHNCVFDRDQKCVCVCMCMSSDIVNISSPCHFLQHYDNCRFIKCYKNWVMPEKAVKTSQGHS